jgi:hypothetical protein
MYTYIVRTIEEGDKRTRSFIPFHNIDEGDKRTRSFIPFHNICTYVRTSQYT